MVLGAKPLRKVDDPLGLSVDWTRHQCNFAADTIESLLVKFFSQIDNRCWERLHEIQTAIEDLECGIQQQLVDPRSHCANFGVLVKI